MKIALSLVGIVISPRFDYAQKFFLVTTEKGTVIERQHLPAVGLTPHTRVRKLTEMGIDILICGSIDRTSAQQVRDSGITIYSWVTGKAEDILQTFLNGKLEPVVPGDHIYVKRKGRFYTHHGIYVGEDKVIHLTGSIRELIDPEVRETDLSWFLKGGRLKRRTYHKRLGASETIRIAKEQLSNKKFSMLWNNCEHFATYCATGKKKSRQLKRALTGLSTVGAMGIVFSVLSLAVRRP